MVKLFGQSVPPSLSHLFYRWIGVPKTTGFNLFITGYAYGIADALGKRMPYRFPPRQGLAGRNITPTQTTQRGHFRAALDVYNEQRGYAPFGTAYGPQGLNLWYETASGFNMFTINYVMSEQIPHEIADTAAPWDPHHYLNIYAMGEGCWHGYVMTPPLEGGTYRVTLMPSWLHKMDGGSGYISAVRVFEGYDVPPAYDRGPIGDWNPGGGWIYGPRNDWAASPGAAWSRYLNDSLHTYRDINLETGFRIMLQFEDRESWPVVVVTGALQVKIDKIA
jgi:hypothetical protein